MDPEPTCYRVSYLPMYTINTNLSRSGLGSSLSLLYARFDLRYMIILFHFVATDSLSSDGCNRLVTIPTFVLLSLS